MKKLIPIFISILFLVSCGGGEKKQEIVPETKPDTTVFEKPKLDLTKENLAMSITLGEIREAWEAVKAANGSCDQCKKICDWILAKCVATGSEAAMDAALAGIFALADIVFVEFDEILIPVEAVCEGVLDALIEEYGFPWLKDNIGPAAEKICQAAKQCD